MCVFPCYTISKSLPCQSSLFPSTATIFILNSSSHLLFQKLPFLSPSCYSKTAEHFECLRYLKGESGRERRCQKPVDAKYKYSREGTVWGLGLSWWRERKVQEEGGTWGHRWVSSLVKLQYETLRKKYWLIKNMALSQWSSTLETLQVYSLRLVVKYHILSKIYLSC